MSITLHVRSEPYFITGRGLAITCELENGQLRIGAPATATIEVPDGEPVMEAISAVVAVLDRSAEPAREWPGLVFAVDRTGERADTLRRLLRPGVRIRLVGPATEVSFAVKGSPRRSRPAI